MTMNTPVEPKTAVTALIIKSSPVRGTLAHRNIPFISSTWIQALTHPLENFVFTEHCTI